MRKPAKKSGIADKGWLHYLGEHCNGSTGYGGNLTGMRKLYWGPDAYAIWCCGFWFRVSPEIFKTVCGRLEE